MSALISRYLVVDDFLGAELSAALLKQILTARPRFTPSEVRSGDTSAEARQFRSSLRLPGRVGVDLGPFTDAVTARLDEWRGATGIPPFVLYHAERSIVAHGDGDFYRAHIDTRTQGASRAGGSVRVLSCVYYLNLQPQAFGGGELTLYPVVPAGRVEPTAVIEPRHDRLAVFPSFVPHEVRPVSCPSGRFEHSRFSINCWLHRAVTPRSDSVAASAEREGTRQS